MVVVNGADVAACGSRSTDPDNFSDAEEAENPSAAALWRNGKPENLRAESDAIAYAKDGSDEYVIIKSADEWDDEIGGFKNIAISLWKNGKETETIFKDQRMCILGVPTTKKHPFHRVFLQSIRDFACGLLSTNEKVHT